MSTYAFTNVHATIDGPNGQFSLGSDSGSAEEGITVDMVDDKNTMTIGAGGSGMHSLHASKAGTITFRYLKTSPVNKKLTDMYNSDSASSTVWGQNLIRINDVARGDSVTAQLCAFKKRAPITYAKDGGTMEWVFDCIRIDEKLGSGTPAL